MIRHVKTGFQVLSGSAPTVSNVSCNSSASRTIGQASDRTNAIASGSSRPRSRSFRRKVSAVRSISGQLFTSDGDVAVGAACDDAAVGGVSRCRRATMRPFGCAGAACSQRAMPSSSRPRRSSCQSLPLRLAPTRNSLSRRPNTSSAPALTSSPDSGNGPVSTLASTRAARASRRDRVDRRRRGSTDRDDRARRSPCLGRARRARRRDRSGQAPLHGQPAQPAIGELQQIGGGVGLAALDAKRHRLARRLRRRHRQIDCDAF